MTVKTFYCSASQPESAGISTCSLRQWLIHVPYGNPDDTISFFILPLALVIIFRKDTPRVTFARTADNLGSGYN
jgi:hypothetical protein